jgi:putative glycosyltransferase (TIGR04372 family)
MVINLLMKYISKDIIISTPRWYSYGGMCESVFFAVNLAKYYKKELIILTPETDYNGVKRQYINDLNIIDMNYSGTNIHINTWYCKLLSWYLDFNRSCFIVRYLRSGLRKFSVSPDNIFPTKIGFTGAESALDIKKSMNLSNDIDWSSLYNHMSPININFGIKNKSEILLDELGINNRKFICLYVRDDGYYKNKQNTGSDYHNANIHNYAESINYIDTEHEDLIFVRVGDPNMIPFQYGNNIIDYVHTPYFNTINSLKLHMQCKFWLGTMGGGRSTPWLFNKVSLLTNATITWNGQCVNSRDVVIFKHIYSYKDKRFLSLSEQLDNFNEIKLLPSINDKYIQIENTSHEIKTLLKEYMDEETDNSFDWNDNLQSKFHNKRIMQVGISFSRIQEINRYIYDDQFHLIRPRVSKFFIENCWEYGNYLENLTKLYMDTDYE